MNLLDIFMPDALLRRANSNDGMISGRQVDPSKPRVVNQPLTGSLS
jgi:hypothetical protein